MEPPSLYDSTRLAAAYAHSRPPVHAKIIEVARARLAARGLARVGRALDVGCGAGLSTAVLEPLAGTVIGLEPVRTMLAHHREVAPGARFVAGRAEQFPFRSRSFNLLTAAGSLNYSDLDRVLPEVDRVLAPGGLLMIYDFSSGRRLAGDPRLEGWFAAFERRYPFPPDYAMDVRSLPFEKAGLRLDAYEEFEVAVPMTGEQYLDYVLSETNVELAVSYGVFEAGIAQWCRAGIADIFSAGPRDVLFDAYLAFVVSA